MTNHDDRIGVMEKLFDEIFPARTNENLDLFGQVLSSISGREDRGLSPWQKTFIRNLLARREGYKVSDEMMKAIQILEQSRIMAVRHFSVLSHIDVSGAIVLGKVIDCQFEDCDARIIKDHPSRKYHTKECRLKARNLRRSRLLE